MATQQFIFRLTLVAVVITLTCALPIGDQHEPGRPYEYEYIVKDNNGNDYGHKSSSTGDVVTGSYHVLLPDGRLQIVNYRADQNGYSVDIRYEWTHSASTPPVQSRQYSAPAVHQERRPTNGLFPVPLSYRPSPADWTAPPRTQQQQVAVASAVETRSSEVFTAPHVESVIAADLASVEPVIAAAVVPVVETRSSEVSTAPHVESVIAADLASVEPVIAAAVVPVVETRSSEVSTAPHFESVIAADLASVEPVIAAAAVEAVVVPDSASARSAVVIEPSETARETHEIATVPIATATAVASSETVASDASVQTEVLTRSAEEVLVENKTEESPVSISTETVPESSTDPASVVVPIHSSS